MKKRMLRNPIAYFVLISCIGYAITLLRLLQSRGAIFDEIFDVAGYFYFGDMIMHLVFVNQPELVYFASEQACFPPLAYLVYYFMNRLLPGSEVVDMNFYRIQPSFILVYVLVSSIICCIFAEEMRSVLKKNRNSLLLALLVICSEPFWASAIERGNSVMLVVVILIGALILKDSDSKVKREVALILIAISAGLKMYPAIFGLLYLIEKRYKEAVRLTIYGILFFFIPFLFFGGIDGIVQFLTNLTTVNRYEGNLYTIQGFVHLLYLKIFSATELTRQIRTLGNVLALCYGVIAVFMAVLNKEYWKKLLFLSSMMVIFVPSSYPYTTIYLTIPFLFFLKEVKEQKIHCWYAVLFGVIFTIMALPSSLFIQWFNLSFAYGIRYIALAVMLMTVVVEWMVGLIYKKNPV
ncbi:MAG: DUF2029 domain-containing protein [Lachnospiraceae bacterium]|nr:DUF2029 domain-containing protein [Lachnospiraceae bacterium]